MHRIAQRWAMADYAVILLLILGGCGVSGPVGTGQSGAMTPGTTHVATMTAIPAVPTPGAVMLNLGQAHASVTSAVSVTLANGLSKTIVVADHQSECTVVTLERRVGSTWLEVAPCPLETPTRLLPIAPGVLETLVLRPEGDLRPGTWQAGTYRFTLRYGVGDPAPASRASLVPAGVVYSQTFTIG